MSDITALYRRVSKLTDDDSMELFERLILSNDDGFSKTLEGISDDGILQIISLIKQIDDE